MKKLNPALLGALAAVTVNVPALAQYQPYQPQQQYQQYRQQQQEQSRPLMGNVQMHVDPTVRIDRNRLRSGVLTNDFAVAPLIPQQPAMAPLVDSTAFKGSVNTVNPYRAAPLLQTVATKSDTNKEPPYIWYQSALGGYYDASGTTKEIVRAERLHLFGGKFQDGTKVPREQIRDVNAMGHAFRSNFTPTTHFWSR